MNLSKTADPSALTPQTWAPRFAQLKRDLIQGNEAALVAAWADVLAALSKRAADIATRGSDVQFADLERLDGTAVEEIKRRGCIVVRGVVPRAEAEAWKKDLEAFIQANPDLDGIPRDNKQFFNIYWSRAQVRARAHPHVLRTTAWLNALFRSARAGEAPGDAPAHAAPLAYADRFRIRKPARAGEVWDLHPPHIDGASIERWEEPTVRCIYEAILRGQWTQFDPYDLDKRVDAKTDTYGRSGQASVFRAFQGWLALSSTAPGEGTLRVFPDVALGAAYLLLRPLFAPVPGAAHPLAAAAWALDTENPAFPGIELIGPYFHGPRVTRGAHPHLYARGPGPEDDALVSVPRVEPGDMVFWHCDLIHAVERLHAGTNDSAVMYIPAVPSTPVNIAYTRAQRAAFEAGRTPPDFGGQGRDEGALVGIGRVADVVGAAGRRAMGFEDAEAGGANGHANGASGHA